MREFLQANTEKGTKRHSRRPSERTVDRGMYVDIKVGMCACVCVYWYRPA